MPWRDYTTFPSPSLTKAIGKSGECFRMTGWGPSRRAKVGGGFVHVRFTPIASEFRRRGNRRMRGGRWNIFKGQNDAWLEEYRLYHRDADGRVVAENDDAISASR
jgi:hypothetical protein